MIGREYFLDPREPLRSSDVLPNPKRCEKCVKYANDGDFVGVVKHRKKFGEKKLQLLDVLLIKRISVGRVADLYRAIPDLHWDSWRRIPFEKLVEIIKAAPSDEARSLALERLRVLPSIGLSKAQIVTRLTSFDTLFSDAETRKKAADIYMLAHCDDKDCYRIACEARYKGLQWLAEVAFLHLSD